MSFYMLFRRQDGQGCDYTIGCGEKLTPLASTSIDDAAREAKDVIYEDGGYSVFEGESKICEALIVEVASTLPLDAWREKYFLEQKEKSKKSAERKERETYEALRKKFGG